MNYSKLGIVSIVFISPIPNTTKLYYNLRHNFDAILIFARESTIVILECKKI